MLENKGKRWDEDEEKILLSELESLDASYKLEMEKIAERHKRTLTAIKARINLIAYNFHKEGHEKRYITEKTKLTEVELEEVIKKNMVSETSNLAYSLYKDGVSMELIIERTNLTLQKVKEIVQVKEKKKFSNPEEQKFDIEELKNTIMLAADKSLRKNEEEIKLIKETNYINNTRFEENILEIKKEIKNIRKILEILLERNQ